MAGYKTTPPMPSNAVVSRQEWMEARKALLEEEKEFTRRSDELARRRRELLWVPGAHLDLELFTAVYLDVIDGVRKTP